MLGTVLFRQLTYNLNGDECCMQTRNESSRLLSNQIIVIIVTLNRIASFRVIWSG